MKRPGEQTSYLGRKKLHDENFVITYSKHSSYINTYHYVFILLIVCGIVEYMDVVLHDTQRLMKERL
jgi:hypothetical protein